MMSSLCVAIVGMWQVVVIVAVLVLLFGAKKIPEIAHSLGKSLNEFKKGQRESLTDGSDDKDAGKNDPEAKA